MAILITSNEPRQIKDLFDDYLELPMGFDFKLYTNSGTVGVERKTPGDLLSSIEDGRLRSEVLAMRDDCDFQIILIHGYIKYNRSDQLMIGKRKTRWTKGGLRNFLRTLEWIEGCYIEYASTDRDLVTTLEDLQRYLDKPRHSSIYARPSIKSDWMVPTKQERCHYWLQGLPKISTVRAKLLLDRFGCPAEMFRATVDEICGVPGIGKQTAVVIHDFLHKDVHEKS